MPVNSSRIDQTDIDQLRPAALLAALAFARHDHAVLPLTWPVKVNGRMVCSCRKAADCISPAKHPFGRLVPRGLLDASTDEVVVRKWWADTPQANLGVVTDKLVVPDIDPRHDGDSSLAALERDHDFPATWRVLTGGGGEHVIFKCSEGIIVNSSNAQSNPLLGPGIDVRARGGYIGGSVAAYFRQRLRVVYRSPSGRCADRRGAGLADRGADREQALWQWRPSRCRAMGHR